jgi:hypothetical protein
MWILVLRVLSSEGNLCSPIEVHRRFGETYDLSGPKINQASSQQEVSDKHTLLEMCGLVFRKHQQNDPF